MSPKRKRSKLQDANAQNAENAQVENEPNRKQPKREMQLLTLNDDCLRSILGKLSLSDLCVVSKVCVRLQSLATETFTRCHKEKVMTLQNITDAGLLTSMPNEKYIKCFAKHIQNVTIGKAFQTKATMKQLSKFYKTTGGPKPIKVLRFEGRGRGGFRQQHGPALKTLANTVESLIISNAKIYGDLNECILKHMPNLKQLTLWMGFEQPHTENINWMEQTYSNLEYFAWHSDKELAVHKLNQFVALNPKLNFISLLCKSQRTLDCLNTVNVHVNQLFFVLNGNMAVSLRALCVLCKQRICHRLHLKIPDRCRSELTRNMNQLIELAPHIEGLYFENTIINDNLARALVSFDQLKVLQFNISANAAILSKVPSLEEIFAYWGVNSSNFVRYREAMLVYVLATPTLKKMYFRNNSQSFVRFKFNELDEGRRSLSGAKKLKIYFKTEEMHFTGQLSGVKCDFDTIEVLRVETEHVNNPLITEYLTTKQLTEDPYYGRRY